MKHAPLILLFLALVVAAVVVSTLVQESPTDEGPAALPIAPPQARVVDQGDVALVAEGGAGTDELVASSARQAAEVATATFDTAAAQWVSGRVVFPVGCTPDETLEVFALDERTTYRALSRNLDMAPWSSKEQERLAELVLARQTVAADGAFRLPFPAERDAAHLSLRGRTLYLAESLEVTLGDGARELELQPAAGTWLRGQLVAPPDAAGDAAVLAGILVECRTSSGEITPTMGMRRSKRISTEVLASEGGAFEFRALPASVDYTLHLKPEHLAAKTVDVRSSVACAVTQVTVELERGGTVEGLVVDAAGEPVAGATVHALLPGKWFGFDDVEAREFTTDATGVFRLAAVPSGAVAVRAKADGLIESDKVKVEVTPDGRIEGLILALGVGESITGTVLREGGGPAADVLVEAKFDQAYMAGPSAFNMLRGAKGETRTDGEGRFRVTGLGGGPFVVTAAAPPAGASGPDSGIEDEGRRGWLTARRDTVQPGATEITLILHPPIGLHGRVVTLGDEIVTKFELTATRVVAGAMGDTGLEDRSETFTSDQGLFFIEDMIEGRWKLHAGAEGFVTVEQVLLELPEGVTEELVVVRMVRASSVRGIVRSPAGDPVAGAVVTVESGVPAWQSVIAGGPEAPLTHTEDDGTFELGGLTPGPVGVFANAENFARGPVVNLELEAGEVLEDVELGLTLGGTLTGIVYDKGGKAAPGRMITLNRMDTFETVMSTTEEGGEFRFDNLEPGHWQVIAMDRSANWAGAGGAKMANMFDSMQMTQATIVEGEATHVVLGAPPKDPVTIHGKVTHGGEPYADALISFFPEGSKLYERMKFTSVGSDGLYELTVDGWGGYVVNVQKLTGGVAQQNTIEFSREVPEGTEYKLDFKIPEGRISGRVLRANGEPAAGARITVVIDGGARSDSLLGGQYAELQTKQDGTYDVAGLRPETYRVSAGGGAFFGGSESATTGRLTRGGVVVSEDDWVQGIDFELPEPGSIGATVLNEDGSPAKGAAIFVRDAEGRFLEPICFSATDGTGKLSRGGLAPGEYTLVARTSTGASQESEPIRVRAGEATQITLRLEPGTIVWIRIQSREGDDLRATIRVVDGEGREVGGMFSMADLQALYMEQGFSPTEHRVGPLPPGRYRIFAETQDGLHASKPVTLRGEAERKVTVRLR